MEQPTPIPECAERIKAKWYGARREMGNVKTNIRSTLSARKKVCQQILKKMSMKASERFGVI